MQNKYNLAAETQLVVKIEDENDNKPNFQEGLVGTVLENEPIGTSVMRVRAYDLDGTSPNNKVKPLSCYAVFEQSKVWRKVQMLCYSFIRHSDSYPSSFQYIAVSSCKTWLSFFPHFYTYINIYVLMPVPRGCFLLSETMCVDVWYFHCGRHWAKRMTN